MSGKPDLSLGTYHVIVAIGFLTLPLAVLIEASVAAKLWGWALVPLGLPPISWAHAFGIIGLAALLTHQVHWNWEDESELSRGERARRVFAKALARVAGPSTVLVLVWVGMKLLGEIQ